MGVTTVGGRRLVGHGGGWPGHITRSLLDPVAGLAVSVLTNAIDGPALELAQGAVRVVDLAAAPPRARSRSPARRWPRRRRPRGGGRRCGGCRTWSCSAAGRCCSRPPSPTHASAVQELEVVDEGTLRVRSGPGYASVGEPVVLGRDGTGAVRTLRTGSGMTAWRLEDLPLPDRVGVGSLFG